MQLLVPKMKFFDYAYFVIINQFHLKLWILLNSWNALFRGSQRNINRKMKFSWTASAFPPSGLPLPQMPPDERRFPKLHPLPLRSYGPIHAGRLAPPSASLLRTIGHLQSSRGNGQRSEAFQWIFLAGIEEWYVKTHTRAHAHTHTHARAHRHTQTHTHAQCLSAYACVTKTEEKSGRIFF